MKVAESKTKSSAATTAAKTSNTPFFSKETQGASAFFGGETAEAEPFFSPRTLQPKLTIGKPNDHYEQQADAVADQVVAKLNAPTPSVPPTPKGRTTAASTSIGGTAVQAKCDHCEQEEKLQKKDEDITPVGEQVQMKPIFDSAAEPPPDDVQRKCAECEKEEAVQRKTDGNTVQRASSGEGGEASSDFSSQLSSSKGGGQPLPADTQEKMGSAMGADFSSVRIHTGSEAAKMSDNINAQAFTHGSDVYFNEGKYNPSSTEGAHLLAHELTHTRQQGSTIRRDITNSISTTSNAVQAPVRQTISTTRSRAVSIEDSVAELLQVLKPFANYLREIIFRAILLHKHEREALKMAYETAAGKTLESAIEENMTGYDKIRALRYLEYGTLRLADKLYFASEGVGTDEDTIYRILPQASAVKEAVEADFRQDYSNFHGEDGSLPSNRNSKNSRIAGLLEDQMSDWELDKAKALYDFGELRPVDEVRIATNRRGTEEDMIYTALTKGMANPPSTDIPSEVTAVLESYGPTTKPNRIPLEAAYYLSYGRTLSWTLNDELSGDDHLKAKVIIGTKSPIDRLRNAEGYVNDDEEAVYDTIRMASAEEKAQMRIDFNNHNSTLYSVLDSFLNSEEMGRVAALLIENPTAQEQLVAADATDYSEVLDTIKKSCGASYDRYKSAWSSDDTFLPDIKAGNVFFSREPFDIVLGNSVEEKIRFSLRGTGTDEDYFFHVLTCFVKEDAEKMQITSNSALMSAIEDDLTSSEYNRALNQLTLQNASPEQMFEQAQLKIGRERSWLGDMTNAASAMDDENREWQYELERAKTDGQLTPEEQDSLTQMQRHTEESIEVYITVRNELKDTVSSIVETAVSVIAAIATGGISLTATLAMAARQVAVAAIATGLARVAVKKAILGDRFDIGGGEAFAAFAGGAVDGVFNVFTAGTAGVAKSAATNAMREVSEQFVREGVESVGASTVRQFFMTTAKEGGSAAVSTAVETAANDETWKHGPLNGFLTIVEQSSTSAAMGGAMSVGFQAGGGLFNRISGSNGTGQPHIEGGQSIHGEPVRTDLPNASRVDDNMHLPENAGHGLENRSIPNENIGNVERRTQLSEHHALNHTSNGKVFLCSPYCLDVTEFANRYGDEIANHNWIKNRLHEIGEMGDPIHAERALNDLEDNLSVDIGLEQANLDFRNLTGVSKGRTAGGAVTGGTVASASIQLDGIDMPNTTFSFGSPQALGTTQSGTRSRFLPNERYTSPNAHIPTRNHAEQTVLGDISDFIERSGIDRNVSGTVHIRADQSICETCIQGIVHNAQGELAVPGIFRQFMEAHPNLIIRATNSQNGEVLFFRGGNLVQAIQPRTRLQ